jgi:hypothetical protein
MPFTMTEEQWNVIENQIKPGQIRKNRRRLPDCVCVVTKMHWSAHGTLRVSCMIIDDDTEIDPEDLRGLDARSLLTMFPHVLWEPPRENEEIPQ